MRKIRRAINQKLQEIFNSQFPEQRFDRRKCTVENWPTDVDWFNGLCWSETDLIKINEGIPFYRFIKQHRSSLERQNISSEVMDCLKNAVLNEVMTRRSTRRILFDRFKLETGINDAQFIDWKLVDQRKIPKKYAKVLINSDTLGSKFIFQNPEIVNNIHFYKNFRSKIEPEYIHDNCPPEELDIFQRDMEISENIQDICDLSNQHMAINANLYQPLNANEYKNLHDFKRKLMVKLKEIFKHQHPNRKFNLRVFKIENWPPGVNQNFAYKWKKDDLNRINESIPLFYFIPRETVESVYQIIGLDKMDCLTTAVVDANLSYRSVYKSILERFKAETGRFNVKRVNWKYLDRSRIPEKYDQVPMNSKTIASQLVFKNPEIVNNIHFFRESAFEENNFEIDYRELQKLLQNDSESNTEIREGCFDQIILDNFDDHQVWYDIENEGRNSGVLNKRLAEDDYDVNNDLKKLKTSK